ncbi:MAG: hypothetical protein ABJB10_13670 [Mesorhizobium sp.]
MRCLIAISLVLTLSTPAWCFDGKKVSEVYDDVRAACRQAEMDGKEISAKDSDRYCIILDALGSQLKANGYCWNASEVEWERCKK